MAEVLETTETIDPTAPGTQTQTEETPGETPAEKFADWDALVKAHPEVDELFEGKAKGLKSALDKERDKAGEASKALRQLAKEADEKTASALKKQADEMDAAAEDTRRELTFTREAVAAGIPADKLARAWLICKNGGFIDKRGEPDIAAMKTELPELFALPATSAPRVSAGTGTQQQAAPTYTFDEIVRQKAKGGTVRPT